MSFRANCSQQIAFTDSFNELTSREQKALEGSWAKTFAEDIFPYVSSPNWHFSLFYRCSTFCVIFR